MNANYLLDADDSRRFLTFAEVIVHDSDGNRFTTYIRLAGYAEDVLDDKLHSDGTLALRGKNVSADIYAYRMAHGVIESNEQGWEDYVYG